MIMNILVLPDFSNARNLEEMRVWTRFFCFDIEHNLPSLYSALALFLAALLSILTAIFSRININEKMRWRIVSIVLLFMSFDEWRGVHEKIDFKLRGILFRLADIELGGGVAWIVLYSIAIFMLAVIFLPLFYEQKRNIKNLLLASFLMFLLGAVVFEFTAYPLLQLSRQKSLYLALMTAEELLEMSSVAILNFTLIKKLCADCIFILQSKA